VGFFGTYLFDGRHWTSHQADDETPADDKPWLLVDIHDSDIATVIYRPIGSGSGVAFLGFTPRTYFEDPDASEPTDVTREARGLAQWWARHHGGSDPEQGVKATELITFLAADHGPAELDRDDDRNLDDGEVFVEVKAARFIAALDLPPINDLSE
jgi:hypothetical protein